jgi:ASC-1-like (ASCH) protein
MNMKKNNSIQIFNMKLSPKPYDMIASGKKTIELRLLDEKRSQIKVGDIIVFTQSFSGESVTAKVVALHKFNTFEDLYKSLPLLKCGYTEENIDSASYQDMTMYYSLDEQRKYGVVGIEICLLSE